MSKLFKLIMLVLTILTICLSGCLALEADAAIHLPNKEFQGQQLSLQQTPSSAEITLSLPPMPAESKILGLFPYSNGNLGLFFQVTNVNSDGELLGIDYFSYLSIDSGKSWKSQSTAWVQEASRKYGNRSSTLEISNLYMDKDGTIFCIIPSGRTTLEVNGERHTFPQYAVLTVKSNSIQTIPNLLLTGDKIRSYRIDTLLDNKYLAIHGNGWASRKQPSSFCLVDITTGKQKNSLEFTFGSFSPQLYLQGQIYGFAQQKNNLYFIAKDVITGKNLFQISIKELGDFPIQLLSDNTGKIYAISKSGLFCFSKENQKFTKLLDSTTRLGSGKEVCQTAVCAPNGDIYAIIGGKLYCYPVK